MLKYSDPICVGIRILDLLFSERLEKWNSREKGKFGIPFGYYGFTFSKACVFVLFLCFLHVSVSVCV